MPALDNFFLIALPYLAVVICLVGSFYRIKTRPMTYSALSSQFLESKGLMWGSLPWHIGIITIIAAHFIAFLVPGFWQALLSNQTVLLFVEAAGLGLSLLCLFGLAALLLRRFTSEKVQSVTSQMDLVVLVVLLLQVALGAHMAASLSWGSLWCVGTTVPYLWSLLSFTPDLSLVQDLPLAAKAHIVLAWVLILLVPFSRLIHMFAVPLEYIGRPWQNVVWVSDRRKEAAPQAFVEGEARRYFVKGGLAAVFGLSLLSVGVFDKIFRFFFGPRLTAHPETELMTTRLSRLEATSSQRKLELERQENDYILVGSLAELSSEKGKYFIDYSMMPALAFKTAEGLPLLISAKCTHLGCTVGADAVDGKILCPCHISYFSIDTGMPNADSPAKTPLPHLGWVVMDTRGNQLASFSGNGAVKGTISEAQRTSARVYIAKAHQIG